MFQRNAKFDRYEVWGLVGEGGMGRVWLAKHAVLSIPVIIKTLRESLATRGDAAKRMFNEARMMARVADSRVVRALDAGFVENEPYLVQEYVDGIDLAELDRARRSSLGVGLPLWLVCHIAAETCAALHAAHQAGVIHRDVKPSNIFAAPGTGIRLGDFGIAVAKAETTPEESSGTFRFMAPEQLKLGALVDRATDVYGAGATTFDLRYGQPPFSALGDIVNEKLDPVFPPPESAAEAYFQHVLRSMLATRKSDRPSELGEPRKHFAALARTLRPSAMRESVVCVGGRKFRMGACEVTLRVGNLADEEADAIVSSANYAMLMRNGVGAALRLRGGDAIEEEALKGGEQALGTCVLTKAGALAARHVIHAVSAWNETSCVGRAMYRALLLSDQLRLRTLAVPALGTGSARVSMETCAFAMMSALRFHLALGGTQLEKVTVVLADEAKLRAFRDVAEDALRGSNETLRVTDVGLAVQAPVEAEGMTQLDASTRD